MKKKIVSFVMAACLSVTTILTGCSAATGNGTGTAGTETAGTGTDTSFADNSADAVSPGEEGTASESSEPTVREDAAQTSTDTETASETENPKIDDGTPWIDSDIKENITEDTPIDPKNDFHLYANKEWILSNELPAGYSSWSQYAEREQDVQKQCIEILNDESIEGHDAELIRTYNNLLLDWDARNKAGVSEIQAVYDRILSAESLNDITKLMTDEETSLYIYSFISFMADVGLNDPDKYIVAISFPALLLGDSAEYSERTELGDMYYGLKKELFAYIAGKLGMSEEDADRTFDAAIELETKLSAKIHTTQEMHKDDYFDKINNEMPYSELISLTKVFPLEQILRSTGYQYEGIYLVFAPDYLKLLDEIYTEENLEGLKSLMLVYYVYSFRQILDREVYDKSVELEGKYFGKSGTMPDNEMAYRRVAVSLPASLQKTYIGKYGSEEDKKKMEELCQSVIDTYREMLAENSWASDEVKNYAIEKLDKITIHAAYPDKFRDTSGLDLSGCSLVEAYLRVNENDIEYNRSLIGTEMDKEMWAEGFDILSCNAFYSQDQNTINMIIGMMGEPFYSSDMSTEELYASIGAFWVGHEISHAFDSSGSLFDADGVYRDWWTKEDKEEFKKRVKKMDDYLDTIVAFDGKHFIGSNIDTEMIADMTGLQCALKMASKVPDFDYQKFFSKYAQMNASLELYSSELSLLLQNEHPLNYARTNVPVQQFDEFYEAFDVKEGDNMYLAPGDRLLIW